MENTIKNSCGGKGCRITILPADKPNHFDITFKKTSRIMYVNPMKIGNIKTLLKNNK